jgi:hypothetical protein
MACDFSSMMIIVLAILKGRRCELRNGVVGGEEKAGYGRGDRGPVIVLGRRTPGRSLHEPERRCSIICVPKPESK